MTRRFSVALLAISALYGSSAHAAVQTLPNAIYGALLNKIETTESSVPINETTPKWSVVQRPQPNPNVRASTTNLTGSQVEFIYAVLF